MKEQQETIERFKDVMRKLIPWRFEDTQECKQLIATVVKPDGTLVLTHQELNKILLCYDQNKVNETFFKYFFASEPLTCVEKFAEGVDKFRTKALLIYGNFHYAFRSFRQRDALRDFIKEKGYEPITEAEFLRDRQEELKSEPIDDSDRWMLGQISYEPKGLKSQERARQVRDAGQRNLRKYLTPDYLDVYVATSMRSRKDYIRMVRFVNDVFTHPLLQRLNLIYFDPTVCYHPDIRTSGLLEGLMLKRAKVTIYHAGEQDTFGKDSELATTLAQGKPAIVYVEKVSDSDARYERLERRFRQFDEQHPLSLQVAINTGVAHGVMVVRSTDMCVKLLYDILLHDVKTDIEDSSTAVRLKLNKSEYSSDSTIRVATKDTLLNRAFWNYYYPREHEELPALRDDP